MRVLGLESSCDETAAAVVQDGVHVLSDVISSQVDVHKKYGGVVPELASRHHIVNIIPVIESALDEAGVGLDDLDGIAVTCGPGLVGALLVALQVGKSIAFAKGLPLAGVHHLEGHLTAVYVGQTGPAFPHVALLVSGGHTATILAHEQGHYQLLGSTRDDAAGEAFDKVAKMLGLGYPGGAVVDRLSDDGDPLALKLPLPMPNKAEPDFSFSGIKTWVRNWIAQNGVPAGQARADLCASFQHTVVRSLVTKTCQAVRNVGVKQVQLAGGVAANRALRAQLREAGEENGFEVCVPPPRHCTDNAVMIAAAGTHRLVAGQRSAFDLNADANLPLPG